MQATRDEILEAALKLSEEERFSIASALFDTLPDETPGLSTDDPQFTEELKRRSGDLEGSVTWEQLRDELLNLP